MIEGLSFEMPRRVRAELRDDCDAATEAAWQALAEAASVANPFHEPWTLAAARALPEAGRPRLLMVWGDDRLDGVLPIATVRRRGLAIAAENWEQRLRPLGEPLVRGGREDAFWRAALPLLAREPGWFLRLTKLDADSASTAALQRIAPDARVTRRYERAVLRGGTTSAAHCAAHVRGKVLKEHRRLRARLAEQGGLTFERLACGEDAGGWVDALFRLEATGWKGRDGVAATADPGTERAFRAALVEAHARGRLDFHRMRVGDATVAALAVIEAGDEAFQLKIAYDEDWASYSPGVLLEMAYLEHALDRTALARVDSCARAGHPMIDRIWPERRTIVSLAVPYPTRASRLVCGALARMRRARTPS